MPPEGGPFGRCAVVNARVHLSPTAGGPPTAPPYVATAALATAKPPPPAPAPAAAPSPAPPTGTPAPGSASDDEYGSDDYESAAETPGREQPTPATASGAAPDGGEVADSDAYSEDSYGDDTASKATSLRDANDNSMSHSQASTLPDMGGNNTPGRTLRRDPSGVSSAGYSEDFEEDRSSASASSAAGGGSASAATAASTTTPPSAAPAAAPVPTTQRRMSQNAADVFSAHGAPPLSAVQTAAHPAAAAPAPVPAGSTVVPPSLVPAPLMVPSASMAAVTDAAVDAFAHLAAAAEELQQDPSGAGEEAFTSRLLRGWRAEIETRQQHQNVLLAKKQQLLDAK